MDDLSKKFYEVANVTLTVLREFRERLRTALDGALGKEDVVKKNNNDAFDVNNILDDTDVGEPKTKEEALRELERIKEEIARQPEDKRVRIRVQTVSENVKKQDEIVNEEELIKKSASKLKDDQYASSSLSDRVRYKISKVIDDLKEPPATTSADETEKEGVESGTKSESNTEGEAAKASEDEEKQEDRNYLWIFVT